MLFIVLVGLASLPQVSCKKILASPAAQDTSSQTLLELLKNNYDFSEIYDAVLRVHLDTLLSGPGRYTFLVPDNVALSGEGIPGDSLSKMNPATLTTLLKYHLIAGTITYASVPQALDYKYTNLDSLPLYFSEPIPGNFQNQNPGPDNPILHVNGVRVTTTDLVASNGVIQVLGGILTYPDTSVRAFLEDNPDYSYFVAALREFNLLNQLDSPGQYEVLAPTNEAFEYDGITPDSISHLDTVTFEKYLFGVNIIPDQLFFESDMNDGPGETQGQNGITNYVTPYYVLQGYNGYSFEAYDVNYQLWYNSGIDIYSLGDYAQITDPNHLANNGIVQGINGIMIWPDSALVHP